MPYEDVHGVDGLYFLGVQLAQGVADAAQAATRETSRQVVALSEAIQRGLAPAEFERAHQAMGERAQRAVLHSYAQTVTRKQGPSGYRRSAHGKMKRYAGGALRRALGSEGFFEATPRGLLFINVDTLNREARHWARINFGALPAGRGSQRQFDVTFSNLVVGAFGLDEEARPGFSIPRGYWFSDGEIHNADSSRRGEDEFYVQGHGPLRGRRRVGTSDRPGITPGRRMSAGIEARNFLDAGIERIANDFGPTYQELYRKLWRQGVVAPGPSPGSVVGPRPTGLFSTRVRKYRRYSS